MTTFCRRRNSTQHQLRSPATIGHTSVEGGLGEEGVVVEEDVVEEGVVDATVQGTGGEGADGDGLVSTRAILPMVDNNDVTAGESVETPVTTGGVVYAQVPGPVFAQTGAINLNNVGNIMGNTTTYHINLNLNLNPIPSPTTDETQTRQPPIQDDAASPSRNTRSERRRGQRQHRRNTDTSLPRDGPHL